MKRLLGAGSWLDYRWSRCVGVCVCWVGCVQQQAISWVSLSAAVVLKRALASPSFSASLLATFEIRRLAALQFAFLQYFYVFWMFILKKKCVLFLCPLYISLYMRLHCTVFSARPSPPAIEAIAAVHETHHRAAVKITHKHTCSCQSHGYNLTYIV